MSSLSHDNITTRSVDGGHLLPPIVINSNVHTNSVAGADFTPYDKNQVQQQTVICARCKNKNAINFSYCAQCGYVLNRQKLKKGQQASSSASQLQLVPKSSHPNQSLVLGASFDENASVFSSSSLFSLGQPKKSKQHNAEGNASSFQSTAASSHDISTNKPKPQKKTSQKQVKKGNPSSSSNSLKPSKKLHSSSISISAMSVLTEPERESSPSTSTHGKKTTSASARRRSTDSGLESIASHDISDVATYTSEDLDHLDFPEAVRKALRADLRSFRLDANQQQQLQEQRWRADILELNNAELMEQMYHKLSAESARTLPHTDSVMSVESIESIGNLKSKKLKSKQSLMSKSSKLLYQALERESKYRRYNDTYMADMESVASLREKALALEKQRYDGSLLAQLDGKTLSQEDFGSSYSLDTSSQWNELSSLEREVSVAASTEEGAVEEAEVTEAAGVAEEGRAWLWGDCLHLNDVNNAAAEEVGTDSAKAHSSSFKKKKSKKELHVVQPAVEVEPPSNNSSFYWGNLVPVSNGADDDRENVLAMFDQWNEDDEEAESPVTSEAVEQDVPEQHPSATILPCSAAEESANSALEVEAVPDPVMYQEPQQKMAAVQQSVAQTINILANIDMEDGDLAFWEDKLAVKRGQQEHFDHYMLAEMSRRYLEYEGERKEEKSSLDILLQTLVEGSEEKEGGFAVEQVNTQSNSADADVHELQTLRSEVECQHEHNLALMEDILSQVHSATQSSSNLYEGKADEVQRNLLQPSELSTAAQDAQDADTKEQRAAQDQQDDTDVERLTKQLTHLTTLQEKVDKKRQKTTTVLHGSAALSTPTHLQPHHNLHSPLAKSMKRSLREEDGHHEESAGSSKDPVSIEFNSNLAIGKIFMMSYDRMKTCMDHIQVDFRVDINDLDSLALDVFRMHLDKALLALSLSHEITEAVKREVTLFHERASLQRSTIACNISEHFMKATKLEKFFRTQYEHEKEQYLKLFGPSVRKTNKHLENDDMRAIQAQATQTLQALGQEIKDLQVSEAQVIRALKQEEFTILETIKHWRPKHSQRITELTIATKRAEGWLKTRITPVLSTGFSFGMDEEEDDD